MQPITVGAYNELITPVFEAQPRQWPNRESKKDMEEAREVSTEKGHIFAKTNNLTGFFETSAKTGSNISEMFYEIADQIVRDRPA